MKKILLLCLALILFVAPLALAGEVTKEVERNMNPAPGEGWLYCTINGELIDFVYTGSVKSMADVTHSFEAETYTLRFVFGKGLEVGQPMEENGLKSIELISSVPATAGYYGVKKTTTINVQSTVLLEKQNEDGLFQGTFSALVHPGDRWVGDLRPGIIEDLALEEGAFCFNQP